jgi:hypothetical protein
MPLEVLMLEQWTPVIERVRAFVVGQGYQPGTILDVFTRGSEDETLVVHFA